MQHWVYTMTAKVSLDELNDLGELGWELVSIAWAGTSIHAAVLKRPRSDDDELASDELC